MSALALQRQVRRQLGFILLVIGLVISFSIALLFGSISIPLIDIWRLTLGEELPGYTGQILHSIRLPRAILAACVGAILAICGAILQGLFRNPLADPSLIGVTAGASVGASLVIVFGSNLGLLVGGITGMSLVSLGAFAGGLVAVWLVYRVATGASGTSVATMLLMGIAVAALAASITGLLEYFADDEMLRHMSLWHMGGLDGANTTRAFLSGLVLLLLVCTIPTFGRSLNTFLLGESQARHLGVDVERLKTRLIILVAAGVGISVAMAGTIAFVGLVIPHMVRLWGGPDHRLLLPLSALGGAVLLLLADTLARTIMAPVELPVGLVTALLGAPLFISLLRRRREYDQ